MKWSHNPFKSYKTEFEMSCKIMKSMAEEIVKLHEENEMLKEENADLQKEIARNADIIEASSQRVRKLHENAAAAVKALSAK